MSYARKRNKTMSQKMEGLQLVFEEWTGERTTRRDEMEWWKERKNENFNFEPTQTFSTIRHVKFRGG